MVRNVSGDGGGESDGEAVEECLREALAGCSLGEARRCEEPSWIPFRVIYIAKENRCHSHYPLLHGRRVPSSHHFHGIFSSSLARCRRSVR